MQKIKYFNVKWALKDRNLEQSHHLNLYIYIWKVSMHFNNKLFIDVLF